MSLGKAMIHARKQKSIARAAALAGERVTIHSAHILQMPVLVLNASYEPINICGARRALVLVLKGVARTEEVGLLDQFVGSSKSVAEGLYCRGSLLPAKENA